MSPELTETPVATGATALENPSGILTHYGYANDVPSPGDPAVPAMPMARRMPSLGPEAPLTHGAGAGPAASGR